MLLSDRHERLSMIKNLIPIGDDLGLVIERPILESLKIDCNTPLEVTTDGTSVYIRPVVYAPRDEVLKAAERVMEIHAETLKRLAE
jgi:antitoxin MazE